MPRIEAAFSGHHDSKKAVFHRGNMRCLQANISAYHKQDAVQEPCNFRADRNWLDIKSTQNRKEMPMSPVKALPYLMKSSAQAVAPSPLKTGTLISETGI
jgi:hypothetical protein